MYSRRNLATFFFDSSALVAFSGYSYMDPKMMRHFRNQPEKATSADESKKKVARFRLEYKDGKWELSSAA